MTDYKATNYQDLIFFILLLAIPLSTVVRITFSI